MNPAEVFEKFSIMPLDPESCHVCGRLCRVVYKGVKIRHDTAIGKEVLDGADAYAGCTTFPHNLVWQSSYYWKDGCWNLYTWYDGPLFRPFGWFGRRLSEVRR